MESPGPIRRHDHSNRYSGGLISGSTVVTSVASGSSSTGSAADIGVADIGGYFGGSDVESVLAEIGAADAAHLADTADAHDASAISVLDTAGLLAATDVEAALAELAAASGAGPDVDLVTVAASGAAETIDVSVARTYDVTLTADCTLTLTGATTGEAWYLTILLRQDGTGGWLVTWPASVEWVGGTAPVLSTTPADVDAVTLFSVDGGTQWIGVFGGGGAGAADLNALTDVTITTPTEGDTIAYRSGVFINESSPTPSRWELVVTGSAPPVAMTTDDGTDFLYAEV